MGGVFHHNCGKTTLARWVVKKLGCDPFHFREVNCADFRGIDFVRDLGEDARVPPMKGPCKVWLMDEVHRMTGEGQDAILKVLEDPEPFAYFILATSAVNKLVKTIVGRAIHFALRALTDEEVTAAVDRVREAEKVDVTNDVMERIVASAGGSARKAIQDLQKVAKVEGHREQLDLIQPIEGEAEAIELALGIVYRGMRWPQAQKLLARVVEDPEGVRRTFLGVAANALLDPSKGKFYGIAFQVLDLMRDSWFDSDAKKANLVAATFALCQSQGKGKRP